MAQNSILSAVFAAGPAPVGDGYVDWLQRVSIITDDLNKVADFLQEREDRKQKVRDSEDGKVFTALLVDAQIITKGTGEKTVQKGELVLKPHTPPQNSPDGFERIETDLLNTAAGAGEFARAKSMVGRQVVIFKIVKSIGDQKKARECAAIELADGAMFAEGPAGSTPTAAPQASPPPVEPPPAREPAPTPEPAAQQPPASAPGPSDPVERAAAAQAVVSQQSAPTPPAAAPSAASAAGVSGLTVESLADLRSAAQQHLAMSLDDVNARINTKFGLPPGEDRQLPKRIVQNFWQELADSCVPVG